MQDATKYMIDAIEKHKMLMEMTDNRDKAQEMLSFIWKIAESRGEYKYLEGLQVTADAKAILNNIEDL